MFHFQYGCMFLSFPLYFRNHTFYVTKTLSLRTPFIVQSTVNTVHCIAVMSFFVNLILIQKGGFQRSDAMYGVSDMQPQLYRHRLDVHRTYKLISLAFSIHFSKTLNLVFPASLGWWTFNILGKYLKFSTNIIVQSTRSKILSPQSHT